VYAGKEEDMVPDLKRLRDADDPIGRH